MAKATVSLSKIQERIRKMYETEIRKYFSEEEIEEIKKMQKEIEKIEEIKKELEKIEEMKNALENSSECPEKILFRGLH